MTVLVGMKLLRQFAIKLGELIGLHVLHAGYQDVEWSVQELVHDVHLVTCQRVVRMIPQISSHVLHCSLIDILFDSGQTFGFEGMCRAARISARPLVTLICSMSLLALIKKLTLHLLSCLAEHFLLHL